MFIKKYFINNNTLKDGHKIDYSLLWMVILLISFSILMIYSASIVYALNEGLDALYYVKRQVIFVGLGLVCAAIAASIPMINWQRMTPYILAISIMLLIVVLIVGRDIKGAKRWIDLGFFSVQPTEIFKLAIILYLSSFFTRKAEILRDIRKMFWPSALLGVCIFLIMQERDLGSTVVVGCITLGLLFMVGLPWKWFTTLIICAVAGLVAAIAFQPYRMKRWVTFLNPMQDPYGDGYQLINALIAFARGGWTGVGLGDSMEKHGYLPEAHTDFILAIISEEFGYVGVLLLIAAYAFLVLRAFVISDNAHKLELFYGAFVAKGIGLWIAIQSFINIGVNIGFLPTKGLTLPLISYGGSSVIMMLVAMALLLRIDYENRRKKRGFTVETLESFNRNRRSQ